MAQVLDDIALITTLYGELRKAFNDTPILASSTNEEVADSAAAGYGEHHNVWLKFDMVDGEPVFRL